MVVWGGKRSTLKTPKTLTPLTQLILPYAVYAWETPNEVSIKVFIAVLWVIQKKLEATYVQQIHYDLAP